MDKRKIERSSAGNWRVKTVEERDGKINCFLKILLLLPVLFFRVGAVMAQQELADSSSMWEKIQAPKEVKVGGKKIQITQSLQLWDIQTLERLGDQELETGNDLYIRRGRLGVNGEILEDLTFNLIFAYDGIGRDKRTAGNGAPNPDDNHDFFLFEARSTWAISPLLNITTGYFRPQVGREQLTAPFKTTSLEYSLSNFQTRAHLVGRGTGRELGINVGGLVSQEGWSFNYNFGFFDISSERLVGSGLSQFPMFTSRLAFSLGDPELKKYGLGYKQSYYGERKGITFGINGSYLAKTEILENNSIYGGDVLANLGPLDFMFEYDWLSRGSILEQENLDLNRQTTVSTTDQVYTYKLAYNFFLKNGKIIQAAAMYTGQSADDYGDTQGLNGLTGATDQEVYDMGINYLINKDKLKLNMHYVWGERRDKMPESHYAYLGTGFQYLF